MPVGRDRTIGYARIGADTYVYVSAKDRSPSNDDFSKYLEFLTHDLKHSVKPRCIVYERYEGITASQRQLLREVIGRYSPVIAVITASGTARVIVTALSWFHDQIRAFSPEDRLGAFRHVGISNATAAEAWSVIQSLERQLD